MSDSNQAATGYDGDQRARRLDCLPHGVCARTDARTSVHGYPSSGIGEHRCGDPTSAVTMCIAVSGSGWTGPESGAVGS